MCDPEEAQNLVLFLENWPISFVSMYLVSLLAASGAELHVQVLFSFHIHQYGY